MRLGSLRNNLISVLIVSLLLSGCGYVGLAQDTAFTSDYSYSEEDIQNIFVSSAQVIFKSLDTENLTMDLYVYGSQEQKTLRYDGATIIQDKYGQPMTASQLVCGDVLNIAYNSELNKIGAIVYTPNIFSLTDVSKYSISDNGATMYIGSDAYSLDGNTRLFSGGQEIVLSQLISHDVLTIQGLNHTIYSIRVEDGHGYLELANEEALVGGWIEIGQSLISQITTDMLFTVPEGDYNVRLTNTGIEENRQVHISRNNITTLDLGDIKSVAPDKGIVRFKIYPDGATTSVDGKEVNTNFAMRFPVGIHEITVAAAGYATVSQYFEVTGESQSVYIDLETITDTVSGNSISKNLYATITVDAPIGAELYEDNIYKGVVPCSYKKTEGNHVLTLRKPGCVTTSYNIYVPDDGIDQKFSFSELAADTSTPNATPTASGTASPSPTGGNSVSGNSISGNSLVASPSPSPTPTQTPSN